MPPDHLLHELGFGNGIRLPQAQLGQEGMSDGILAEKNTARKIRAVNWKYAPENAPGT